MNVCSRALYRTAPASLVFVLAIPATAQQWLSMETAPFGRTSAAAAADPRSGRMLLFGGLAAVGPLSHASSILWMWTGQGWNRHGSGVGPVARIDAAMALDSVRGRVVMFGGSTETQTLLDDTWEWDGSSWFPMTPATRPPASATHALAFDPSRGRTVAFGGGFTPWTFEWDGTNWRQIAPPVSPPGRTAMSLVFDAVRQRVLLFGGYRYNGFTPTVYGNDLWEFDGVTWSPVVTSPPAPTRRAFHSAAWDAARNRMVVFGGEQGFLQLLNDTWEWDGQNWHATSPTSSPPSSWSLAMHFDAVQRRVVMAGATIGSGTSSAVTWQWDGSTWSPLGAAYDSPEARSDHGFVPDVQPGRFLSFGGSGRTRNVTTEFGDTWLWQDGRWSRATPPTAPSPRYGCAMACDRGRNRVVLFGGSMPGRFDDGTWEWDGTTWAQLNPAVRPSARAFAAAAYDAARGVTVLFGGSGGFTGVLGDAWTWDGTTWRAIAGGPPARWAHAMTYDSSRQRVVMYGGSGVSDWWEWDGVAWTQGVAPPGPVRHKPVLFHDPVRQRTVFHGGTINNQRFGDTQEWDGVAWTTVNTAVLPPTATSHCAAFDPALGRVLVFAGNEVWTLSSNGALSNSSGDPCPGISGLPRLLAAGRPYVGNRSFQLWLDQAPPLSLAAVLVDLNPGTVPLPGNCRSLLSQPVFYRFGICDAGGGLSLPMPLGASNALRGLTVYAQAVATMANGPLLGAFVPTARLALSFGD